MKDYQKEKADHKLLMKVDKNSCQNVRAHIFHTTVTVLVS